MRNDGSMMVILTTLTVALMVATLPLAFRAPWTVLVLTLVGAAFIAVAALTMRRSAGQPWAMALLAAESAVALGVIATTLWVGAA